ncbi:MAG TPA: hypothetical protein VJG90_03700 [Candidatus Nanoarchaeia archaeon]|nr:hypothetical protein [Candidatus Nanoarchaeia archaeon]
MNQKGKIATITSLLILSSLLIAFVLAAPKECRDHIDNDGDGQIDYPADAGCTGPSDNDETNCGDGVCEGGETPATCPADCGSGNFTG